MHRIRTISNHLNNTCVLKQSPTLSKSQLFGGDIVSGLLKTLGIETVFTLTGGHISQILVGCDNIGIRVIDVRDEVTTVFAADAHGRLQNKGKNKPIPGIAVCTAGPGLTNIITALKNAQMAESPVIVFGGATAQMLKGRGSLQDIDQESLLKPHVKYYKTLTSLKDIVPTIYQAFKISISDIPGPVFIECPLDILYARISKNDLDKYLRYDGIYSKNIYYNTTHFENDNNGAYGIDYDLIINKLQSCKRPLFVLGSQLVNCQYNSSHKLNKLLLDIETLNIPCYLSGMSRGLLGYKHKLHFRHKRSISIKKCDILFLLGVPCDFRLGYGRSINKNAYLIMINIDNKVLAANDDWRQKDLVYHFHPGIFLETLTQKIGNISRSPNKYNEWMIELNNREEKREKEIDVMMVKNEIKCNLNSTVNKRYFVDPIRCCRIIDDVINNHWNEDVYIVADGGDFVGTASYIVKPSKYLHWLDPGAFGTLGCGAGFAIGIKALKPNSTVIILYGDGAFGWSICEFDTLARHGLNVIAIIGNDACWSQMYRGQMPLRGNDVATKLNYTNYDEVVKPFGCKGIFVNESNQLKDSLNLALEYSKQGFPVCVNVLTSTSNFRDGSTSM